MEGLTNTAILWRGGGAGGSVNSGYPPAKCTNFVAKVKNNAIELTWNDPVDIASDNIIVKWERSVVVRKVGSYPTSEKDGVIIVSNIIRNQYATNPYIDNSVVLNTTYYYAVFSCSDEGVYNRELVTASATPISYKIMTVRIDFNNSDPTKCGSYEDDAVGMYHGKQVAEWDKFFGYKPCLFKDGKVVGYLNPNDYGKFADGRTADITSGNAGDVMVEFPRRGLKISKSGKILTVSMTDDPNNPEFTYYAHTRGSANKDYFYMGAYLAYVDKYGDAKLRSISGQQPTISDYSASLSDFRRYAKNTGSDYINTGFYQFLFLQCMYLLQYKGNLDSQRSHGDGFCQNGVVSGQHRNTGGADKRGMMYGAGDFEQIKIFGIEDLWGNLDWVVDGYYVDSNYNILTATDNYNDSGSGYKNNGSTVKKNMSGYIKDITGNAETGFTPINMDGSSSTYFCDYGMIFNGQGPRVGGCGNRYGDAGIFYFFTIKPTNSGGACGRLGYL